jgi:hypothetical protein
MWNTATIIARGAVHHAIVGVVCVARLMLPFVTNAAEEGSQRTRGDVLTTLDTAQKALAERPDDARAQYQVARLLYESGDFWQAAKVVRPLVDASPAAPDALSLSADLEYMLGSYPQSERLYRQLLARQDLDSPSRVRAQVGLGLTLYQTNRFDRFQDLKFERGAAFPGDKLIRSFAQSPYRLQWADARRMAEVPFLITDPLPLMTVECESHPVDVLFDTGADMCIIDTLLAKEWGVEVVSSSFGEFGGGKLGRVGYGKLKSMRVDNVSLQDIPVLILPTQQFSSAFANGKYKVGGIIGTALIRQFVTTLDYEHGRLVLRERSPESRAALRKELAGQASTTVPFALTSTHWMMAPGSLNELQGMTFFVDSGLASQAAFAAPPQTLQYAGIPQPEKKLDPTSIGGGGGKYASGIFSIESIGLGSLLQRDLVGEFGSRPASSYWQTGFIVDGLISHSFLRKYASWSIDFDAMEFLFTNPVQR